MIPPLLLLTRHLIANIMRLIHAVISPAARHRPRTKNKKAKESKYELGVNPGGGKRLSVLGRGGETIVMICHD